MRGFGKGRGEGGESGEEEEGGVESEKQKENETYIRSLPLILRLQHIPQHIHLRVRFERDASLHAAVVDVLDQSAWSGLGRRGPVGGLGGRGVGEAGFVVEGVEVGARVGKGADPTVGLLGG